MTLTDEGAEIFSASLDTTERSAGIMLAVEQERVWPCPSVDHISFPAFTAWILPVFLGLSFSTT